MSRYQTGTVTQVDTAKARARVEFADMDALVSHWLPVLHAKTLQDKAYFLPDVGEHVVCLLDDNCEAGVILGAIYSDADEPPVASQDKCHLCFKDGTMIEYDRSAHKLTAHVAGDVALTATGTLTANVSGNTTLTTPQCTINGNLMVNGQVVASGNITDLNGAKGSLSVLREAYNQHRHGNSEKPVPQV